MKFEINFLNDNFGLSLQYYKNKTNKFKENAYNFPKFAGSL